MAFDGIKRLVGRTKEAGQELLNVPQLSEQDLSDPSALPNEQMAGAGLGNVLKAIGKLAPTSEDMPMVLSKENAARYGVNIPEDIKFDPTMGIVTGTRIIPAQKRPIDIQAIIKNPNATVPEIQEAFKDRIQKLRDLLEPKKQIPSKVIPEEDVVKMIDLQKLQDAETIQNLLKGKK